MVSTLPVSATSPSTLRVVTSTVARCVVPRLPTKFHLHITSLLTASFPPHLQGKTGIIIVKTTQAIIVAHYGENNIAGNSTQTVEALADYLVKAGY